MKRPVDQIVNTVVRRVCAASVREIDSGARTVELAFASEHPVDRLFYVETLSLESSSVRAERLSFGAPLLDNHNPDCQIGVVESWRIDEDRVARAIVRFSKSAKGEEFFQDVIDGIRRSVSVGYLVHKAQEISGKSKPEVRVTDWEPLEISIVSIPADVSVGVGRSATKEQNMANERMAAGDVLDVTLTGQLTIDSVPEGDMTGGELPAETLPVDGEMAMDPALNQEDQARTATAKAVVNFGNLTGTVNLARTYLLIEKNPSIDGFRQYAARSLQQQQRAQSFVTTPQQTRIEVVSGPTPRYIKGKDAKERAYRTGRYWLATIFRNQKSIQWCRENGIQVRGQNEAQNEKGAFLVIPEISSEIIDLREQYGIARQYARVWPMGSDVLTVPRRKTGVTASFYGEAAQVTAVEKTWDNVSLTARKLAVRVRYSKELDEDAIINIGDDLTNEIAYAFALKEDQCFFNGDGTATYGNIVGVREKLKGLSGTIANIAGLVVATGNAYSEIVLSDFNKVVGRLPEYAEGPNVAWFVSKTFWAEVMQKLSVAAGGVTAEEIEGVRTKMFMGYPVVVSQVLPKTEANSQVCALFGDLSKAAAFGDRKGLEIEVNPYSRMEYGEIEIFGNARFDINVHDIGNADATAANREPGPVVGLITAAS